MKISFVENRWMFEQLPYVFEITDEARTDILNHHNFDVIQYMRLVLGKNDQYIDSKYLDFLKQDIPKIDSKIVMANNVDYYLVPMIDDNRIKFNVCSCLDGKLPQQNQYDIELHNNWLNARLTHLPLN